MAYAVEARRRIKEQMNKRKPDDEFANINLSFFSADGKEIIVYCPESKNIKATQQPKRKSLDIDYDNEDADVREKGPEETSETAKEERPEPEKVETPVDVQEPLPDDKNEDTQLEPERLDLKEQHYTIFYGDMGFSYETIIGPYLKGAKEITIEDPYIRMTYQIQNFIRLCETIVKHATIRKINLITNYDDSTNISGMRDNLEELKQSLVEIDIVLVIKLDPNMHDREIRIDNGWVIKIGRGLDFYQKPNSWFEIGANDLSLRKCLETKVDIYKADKN